MPIIWSTLHLSLYTALVQFIFVLLPVYGITSRSVMATQRVSYGRSSLGYYDIRPCYAMQRSSTKRMSTKCAQGSNVFTPPAINQIISMAKRQGRIGDPLIVETGASRLTGRLDHNGQPIMERYPRRVAYRTLRTNNNIHISYRVLKTAHGIKAFPSSSSGDAGCTVAPSTVSSSAAPLLARSPEKNGTARSMKVTTFLFSSISQGPLAKQTW